MARIDVFIPVYNDLQFLPAAVASVLAQQGVDVRVVVSDNASTDGTSEWLSAAAAREPRIVVHRNASNIGMVANLNRYRELVETAHYMLLCSDDILYARDALAKAAAVVEADTRVVSVYCDLAFIDGKGRHISTRRFGRSGEFSAEAALYGSLRRFRNLFGIPLLNRTDVMRQLVYPDGLTYSADVHLSMQAARHGPIHHIAEPLIGNRYTGRNMTVSVFHESRAQFSRLEQDFGVHLTGTDRLVQSASYPLVTLAKQAFLAYVRLRS